MIKCPNCGHENAENEKICVRCGALLTGIKKTVAFDDTDYEEGVPKWGSARFTGQLVLEVLNASTSFEFNADGIDEIDMGRKDPDTGDAPDVDLSEEGALEKGVSRRHAVIVRRDGALHIVDNNSANGTYLNGQKLVAHQPRILRDGDDIRLGHLTLRVTFRAHRNN